MPSTLSKHHRSELHASGLTDAMIKDARVYTESNREKLARLLGRDRLPAGMGGPALVYRFFKADGSDGYCRIKPDHPRKSDGKIVKYESPVGTPNQIYLPPGVADVLGHTSMELFIVEGEKKALKATQEGFPAIGLVGVYGWKVQSEERLLPELEEIAWRNRVVWIVYDSDVSLKQDVCAAERRLAQLFRGRGAIVRCVRLPDGPAGDDGEPTKQEVDDFLVNDGAEEFRKLLDGAEEFESPIPLNNLISLTGLGESAYHGFVGDFLRAVEPYTEASAAGILAHLLPAVGTIIGPGPHACGGDEQPARLNTMLVGGTASGRKGTARGPVNKLMLAVDDEFWTAQCVSGLSSGEGLIQKVSDREYTDDYGNKQTESVEKRLYVVEPEFSSVLAHIRREGNILSQVLRETFDSGDLGVLTRKPLSAKGAHICITGHITPEELRRRFSELEMANGFGNRFLWFYSKSDRMLPDGRPISSKIFEKFAKRLKAALSFAQKQGRVERDEEAGELWQTVYPDLHSDKPGLQGAMVARGAPIILRIALIYALLSESPKIRRPHLEAALAIWHYN
jgi:Domain of unknown function (DUF3854)/Protein of unknown function (DUF3987)